MIDGLDHTTLVKFATRLAGQSAAEDLVQEMYLRILTTPSPFKGEAQPMTWATAIIKRLVIDASRKRRLEEIVDEPTAITPDPVAAIDAERFIARLDAEAQLFLHAWDGSLAVTADTLGWSRWKARQVLARIRRSR